ncbi:MAG: PQQ-binding-like beta-propeller repeat protein [Rhizomicrobium sp.]|jgi:outer membrane protein assembly factor BamB
MRIFRYVAASALLALIAVPADGANANGPTDAVAYQMNVAHSGGVSMKGFAPPLTLLWSQTGLQSGPASYPLIADGKVFVTTNAFDQFGNYNGIELYALNATTGAILWNVNINNQFEDFVDLTGNAAYDNGQVFVADYFGYVMAFDADTGQLNWQVVLDGGQTPGTVESPPTASNGTLYVDGGIVAISESNGKIKWFGKVDGSPLSSPAIGDNGIYVTYDCQYYKFALKKGKLLWHPDNNCGGGGGYTPAYFEGSLYVRDPNMDNSILSASTGATIGSFPTDGDHRDPIPAFFTAAGKNYMAYLASNDPFVLNGYTVANGTLTTLWNFSGDGTLASAPIVVNGDVIEGSSSGNLYMLSGKNGQVLWSTNIGTGIPAPNDFNGDGPLTGLAAGDGILVVPGDNGLYAFGPANAAGQHRSRN